MKNTNLRALLLSAIFAVFITIGAYISLPMPLVPFTMQVMFVMMAGQLGGRRIGFNSVLIYIILGLVGVPVFSSGGGLPYILRPTFGYILGFLVASYVIGFLVQLKEQNIKTRIMINFVGMISIYLFGYVYYILLCNLYLKQAVDFYDVFYKFVLIFIPKEILSCIFAGVLSDKIAKIFKINYIDNRNKI